MKLKIKFIFACASIFLGLKLLAFNSAAIASPLNYGCWPFQFFLSSNYKFEIPETQSAFLKFYSGNGTDGFKRRLSDIWSFDNSRLETDHEYIQWIFPLQTRSQFSLSAPILTPEEITLFQSSPKYRKNLLVSLDVMLRFYGLVRKVEKDGSTRIQLGRNFKTRSQYWIGMENHNYMRITRILTSLNTLGLSEEAHEFFRILEETIYPEFREKIGNKTLTYWANSLN